MSLKSNVSSVPKPSVCGPDNAVNSAAEGSETETQEVQQNIPEAEPKQQTGRGDELNPDDYAVDKIFSNSNGKMSR